VPGITPAVPEVASQATMAVVRLPPEVPMQRPASATSIAVKASIAVKEDDAQKNAGSHRPDLSWSRDARLPVLDDPAPVTSPAALSSSKASLETVAVKSDTVSETAALMPPSDILQAISYGTDSSPPLPGDQGQPAVFADRTAPADQIVPALVGMPRTADGASSVIVHSQPTKHSEAAIALPPDKAPRNGSGRPIRTDQASGTDAAPGHQAAMGKTVPGITPAVPHVASQANMAVVRLPPEVPMQRPASATSIAVKASIAVKEDDAQKNAGSHRPDLSWSRDARLPVLDDPALVTSPAALSSSKATLETIAVKPDTVSETAALTPPSDILQAISFGTGSSPLSPGDQGQPVVFADRTAPVDQITPALVGILKAVDTTLNVTIRLQPVELGQVQIRVDQTTTGNTHIQITVERPETLQLLQRDEPKLQQVLDQAGVLSTGRTVSFQVAPHDQIGAATSRPDNLAAGSGGPGQGHNGSTWHQNDDAPRNPGRTPNIDQRQARPRWFRAGLDITA
jgi:hypothetical protein